MTGCGQGRWLGCPKNPLRSSGVHCCLGFWSFRRFGALLVGSWGFGFPGLGFLLSVVLSEGGYMNMVIYLCIVLSSRPTCPCPTAPQSQNPKALQTRQWHLSLELFDEMARRSLPPDKITFGALEACLERGCFGLDVREASRASRISGVTAWGLEHVFASGP